MEAEVNFGEMLGLAGLLILVAAPGSGMSASRQNAAADAVVQYGLALGIDPDPDDRKAPHPAAADAERYDKAGASAWLSSQIEDESDEIGKPPAPLREYLRAHQDELRTLVAALQKDAPDWGEPPEGELPAKHFLLTMRVLRVLLATALVEDFDGNFIESDQALEASWSLLVPMAKREKIVEQLIAIAIERLQAGVLRKVKQPSLSWQGRLSSNGPWKRMLDTIRSESTGKSLSSGTLDPEPYDRFYREWMTGMNDLLEKLSPCELGAMSDEEFGRTVEKALPVEASEAREVGSIDAGILTPNLLNAARRAGRTEIDREVTLRVLQARFEKAATPSGRWPDQLVDRISAVCPVAEYSYRADRSGIEIRFEATMNQPTYAAPAVPLVFRSHQPPPPTPSPTPTKTRPVLTPTPPAHRLLGR